MVEFVRLHHCYKYGIKFRAWYTRDSDGKETCLTTCPATLEPRTVSAKCDGLTPSGSPCPFRAQAQALPRDPK